MESNKCFFVAQLVKLRDVWLPSTVWTCWGAGASPIKGPWERGGGNQVGGAMGILWRYNITTVHLGKYGLKWGDTFIHIIYIDVYDVSCVIYDIIYIYKYIYIYVSCYIWYRIYTICVSCIYFSWKNFFFEYPHVQSLSSLGKTPISESNNPCELGEKMNGTSA